MARRVYSGDAIKGERRIVARRDDVLDRARAAIVAVPPLITRRILVHFGLGRLVSASPDLLVLDHFPISLNRDYVMAALVAAIHALRRDEKDVDARDKPAHDGVNRHLKAARQD
jgi:hypothetical protein